MTYPEHPPIRPEQPCPPSQVSGPVPLPPPVQPYQPAGAPYPGAPYPGAPYPGQPARRPQNGLGTAGMILGIIGVVGTLGNQSSDRRFDNAASMLGYFTVPITLGVLAVVFGAVGQARVRRGEATNSGRATTALVLGIITLVLSAVLAVVGVATL